MINANCDTCAWWIAGTCRAEGACYFFMSVAANTESRYVPATIPGFAQVCLLLWQRVEAARKQLAEAGGER